MDVDVDEDKEELSFVPSAVMVEEIGELYTIYLCEELLVRGGTRQARVNGK